MKFDFIIGNPPYQDEAIGENTTFAPPIYHKFLDAAYGVADKVELIHPARFLFNAGSTPKDWNRKMLNDRHLKVIDYKPKSADIFSNTDIKGGVAITYRDTKRIFGPIGTFTPFSELNSILHKVKSYPGFESICMIAVSSYSYHFTEALHKCYPNAANSLSKGHAYDLKSSVFDRLPEIFTDEKPDNGAEYVKILGRLGTDRVYKWIRASYIDDKVVNFYKYKVLVPAANGSGALGEVLSTPVIGQPVIGHTETFMSIGCFETEGEAAACLKYIKSKFARVLLGILKITQHITPDKWQYVPLQDFTPASDIDWTASIPDIDKQLYAKYGLDEKEIEFIETHVKEMQ